MTNGTKILIGIVVVATIITGGIVSADKALEEKEKKKNEASVFDVIEDNNYQKETEIEKEANVEKNEEENNIVENIIENTIKNEVSKDTVEDKSNTQTEVIGKEEQESSNENQEIDNESVAIDLAKQEWGIDIDSYNFEAKSKGNGVYEVSVINKTNRTVITIYNVNVRTGAVTE